MQFIKGGEPGPLKLTRCCDLKRQHDAGSARCRNIARSSLSQSASKPGERCSIQRGYSDVDELFVQAQVHIGRILVGNKKVTGVSTSPRVICQPASQPFWSSAIDSSRSRQA